MLLEEEAVGDFRFHVSISEPGTKRILGFWIYDFGLDEGAEGKGMAWNLPVCPSSQDCYGGRGDRRYGLRGMGRMGRMGPMGRMKR
jgi:hypothetical protein